MKTFYVYAHYRNDNGTVFYIGKGSGNRAYSDTGRNRHWRRIVKKHGYTIKICADNMTEAAAFSMEREWIALYGRTDIKTGKLTNQTDGGEGLSGRTMSLSERLKISERLKGNTQGKANKGYRHTDEAKIKMRDAKVGKKQPLSQRKKISLRTRKEKNPFYGKNHTKETIKNLELIWKERIIAKGRLPGATKKDNRWYASKWCGKTKTRIYLGCYLTEQEAHDVWMKFVLTGEKPSSTKKRK